MLAVLPLTVAAEDWIYRLRPGDNLWNITTQHLKHIRYWKRLQKLNNAADPWRMLPGSEIRIPLEWVKLLPTKAVVLEVLGGAKVERARQGNRERLSRGAELNRRCHHHGCRRQCHP